MSQVITIADDAKKARGVLDAMAEALIMAIKASGGTPETVRMMAAAVEDYLEAEECYANIVCPPMPPLRFPGATVEE